MMTSAMPDIARPIVMVLVGMYSPGYKAGGPIRSLQNMVSAIGEEFHFKIVTLDRDLGDKEPFAGIATGQWLRVGNADVMYLPPRLRGLPSLWSLHRSLDQNTVLYVNSFYARRSMLAVFMHFFGLCCTRRLVLAPRGEFAPGAMQFKSLRKRWYIKICQWLGIYEGVVWHASSDFEAADIRRQFPRAKHIDVADVVFDFGTGNRRTRKSEVATAPDIASQALPQSQYRQPKRPGQLRVVFVARIARNKNLAGALRMLRGVLGDVSFDIYGPAENANYWEECQALIAELPPNIQVRYWGQVEHEKVWQVFGEHDLFLFPTLGENYGHVICEALASGCPVLLSDQTPWRNLEEQGIGWGIPLSDTGRFQSVLQQCVDGDEMWHAELSKRAMDYAAKHAFAPETIDANRKLFHWAFARPDHADAVEAFPA